MNMLLCQITTITFVVYAAINSVIVYKLRREVKTHKEMCANGNSK